MAFSEHSKDGVVFLKSGTLGRFGGAVHGFSTRLGGVSEGIYASLNLGYRAGTTRRGSMRISGASARPWARGRKIWSVRPRCPGMRCASSGLMMWDGS
jgi:hypothetical protein